MSGRSYTPHVAGEPTFGAMLRQLRRRAGLSQEELANRAYVSTRAVSDLERGVNLRPRLHTAVALADGLGLTGDERAEFERHARPDVDAPPDTTDLPLRARPPIALDSFVDDGSSLADLVALVADRRNRLITLIGPGGVGKTRLATEVAHRLEGPVAFVALASLNDAGLFAATLGDALEVEHGPTRTHLQSLVEHLASRRITLVLDNMEQIAEAAGAVGDLLRSCPDLQLVVTSRVPLRIAGEIRFPVRALDGGGADPATRPGVRLFLTRAEAIGFGDPHADDLAAVVELCDRLDGLPLAIELAAARARVVPPTEMLQHLDRMLDLLSSSRSDAPSQHRSMRAALEWSYRLLAPAAQEAFVALGAFAAGASMEAAMTVWGLPAGATPAFFDLVQELSEAHLITVEQDGSGRGVRLEMFESTRQFARDQLDDSDAAEIVHGRLTEWALDLVGRAESALFGPDQGDWLDLLDRELPNLRAVRKRLAASGDEEAVDAGLRLVGGLQRFWDIRSRWLEGVAWLSDALARPGGDPANRGKAHKALGVMNRCLGNLEAAAREGQRAFELYESVGDEPGAASCLNNRGVVALDRADFETADAVFRQALALCESHGDGRLVAIVLNNLILTTTELGKLREAFALGRRSRRALIEQGNVFTLSWVDDNIAHVLTLAGHPRWAVPIHEQAIRRRLALRDESGLVWSLEALARAWTALGETAMAGRALGFVAAHRQRLGAVPVPYLAALTERRTEALVARIGAERFAELWDEGAALDPATVWGWFTD